MSNTCDSSGSVHATKASCTRDGHGFVHQKRPELVMAVDLFTPKRPTLVVVLDLFTPPKRPTLVMAMDLFTQKCLTLVMATHRPYMLWGRNGSRTRQDIVSTPQG